MTAGLDTPRYALKERPALSQELAAAELAQLRNLREAQRTYVMNLISVQPGELQTLAKHNLHATGYIGGGDSAGARADDSYHW